MPDAISNTSPLLYLYRIRGIEWLPALFSSIWIPSAVKQELHVGSNKGYDAPDPDRYAWLTIVDPATLPSAWLALDVGPGELAAMTLALEHPERIILLDDMLARRIAQAAGLQVWGTLKVLLEAKAHQIIERVEPYVLKLNDAGMWMSTDIKRRILKLADEL